MLRMAHKRAMETCIAGGAYSHAAGDEVDLPDGEAIALIRKGYAVPAARPAAEKAVARRRETRAAR